MICPSGPLLLGYEATMFPTFFMKNGRANGINVWLWREFARMNGCSSVQLIEFPMNGSSSSSNQTPLRIAMDKQEIFTSVDSPFLEPQDLLTYKYSVMSDFARLVMMEGHPRTKDTALNISFYAVFEPRVLALISCCFIFRWLLDFLRMKLVWRKRQSSYRYETVINLLDFVSRFIHLSMITLLFLFYQCLFNGNAVIESAQVSSDFRTVTDDLLRGTRRMLIDIGILMEDEYTSFGPLTIFVDSAKDRIIQMCSDNDDVVLFWDDEMLLITEIERGMISDCTMNRKEASGQIHFEIYRINMQVDLSLHPLPRLRESMQHGQTQHLIFPRNSTRKALKIMNHLLLTVFRYEMRTGFLSRRLVPARDHGTAFAAYQATFATALSVENISTEWRSISLIHFLYPVIGFCIGLSGAMTAFAFERLSYLFKTRCSLN